MKWSAAIGTAVGVGLSVWLLRIYGMDRILDLLREAGWIGIGAVIAFHAIQVLFSAGAWCVITGPVAARPGLPGFMVLRWIREGLNNLLPVAQIGGEFATARLLHLRGMPLAPAIAGTVVDLTMEMVTQILFTLLGLVLLLYGVGDATIGHYVEGGLAVAAALAAGLIGAQWLGLARLIERGLLRMGQAMGWRGTEKVAGLHDALIAIYRRPLQLALAATWHSVSWLLGGLEVMLAVHFLGREVDFSAGLIIESLGQALKSVGFAVPGALGVQEGGYIIVSALFGLSPELAIALSLIKRLREVVLGVPGLVAWQWLDARGRAAAPVTGAVP